MTAPRSSSVKSTTPSISDRSESREYTNSNHKRRRGSRAGTRSVSTLSASQLERKRANDREAQRTIRQRTKEHIESLENRVNELTARGRQLDDALAKNSILENRVAELKQQLTLANEQLTLMELQNSPLYNPPFGGVARTDSSQSTRAYSPATTEGSHSGMDWEGAANAMPFHQGSCSTTSWPTYSPTSGAFPNTSMPPDSYVTTAQYSSGNKFIGSGPPSTQSQIARPQTFGFSGQERPVYGQSAYHLTSYQNHERHPYTGGQ